MAADDTTPTAIGRARRGQIVDAVVALVAREGYRAATYSRVATHAGLSSTRLISYHFASKDELIGAVVATIAARIEHDIDTALGVVDAPAQLATYIRAVARLHDERRDEMLALAGIVLDHRGDGDRRVWEHDDDRTAIGRVTAILRSGQASGHFRGFDPFVMASAVQRSLDGLAFLLGTAPDLDPAHYADELVTAFDLATRTDDPARRSPGPPA